MQNCINITVKNSSVANINTLQAYMATLPLASFADIRTNVPVLAGLTDSELSQVSIDAGFAVTNS